MYRLRPLLALLLLLAVAGAHADTQRCLTPGEWWQDGRILSTPDLMARAADRDVVLLGEHHDRMADHRFELQTLAGLAAHRDNLVIGLEMLPRSAQPVLDDWVAGKLSEEQLLKQSRWREAWGYDPALYMPIFHFARMNRIPIRALNIAPALRRRLAREGFDAVPADERHGIAPPSTPRQAYRQRLRRIYDAHPAGQAFDTFLQAQLTWDAAMADALAGASDDDRLVVGLMGTGHLRHNNGVAHQLAQHGINNPMTLLPLASDRCQPATPRLADARYALEAAPQPIDFMERLEIR